jgi:Transposase IS116/IS110/IS902 family
VALALRMIDRIDLELAPLDRARSLYARRQPGCRELIARLHGVGPVTATAIVAELGDARRFRCSDDAVRHCGLDVTVHQSDNKRAPGHLSHERPELLRWALFEAAQQACRPASPDHQYYRQVARRIDHNRACLSVARKLCRPQPRLPLGRAQALPTRAPHPARTGEEALAPIDAPTDEHVIAAAASPSTPPRACRSSRRCFAVGSRMEPAASAHQPGQPLKTERPQTPDVGRTPDRSSCRRTHRPRT